MLKRKNMGHISNFNLETSVSRVKNIRICLQIKISPFSTHYLYPNNIVEEYVEENTCTSDSISLNEGPWVRC